MFAIMYPEIPSETLSRISVKAGFADDLIILAFAALPRCGPFLKQEGLGPPRSMKLVFSRGDPLVARGRFEWTLENNGTQNLPRNHLSPPHPSFFLLSVSSQVTAFLISRILATLSRMFPLRLPRHKCRICGVEVEYTQVKVHYQTTHPEYGKWGRQLHTLMWLVLGSGVALVIVDLLYRSLDQVLQYIIPAYLLGACFLLIGLHVRKLTAFRDAWEKTHLLTNEKRTEES